MPLVEIRVPQGSLSQAKKELMIRKVTDAIVEAEGYPEARAATWIIIDEVAEGSWGVAGQALKLEEIARALGIKQRTAGAE
jgi:4-oxalocrotonate tautomerase